MIKNKNTVRQYIWKVLQKCPWAKGTIICFKNIHNEFVAIPVDKANGNVAVICQRLYALILTKELGIIKIQIAQ